MNLNIFAKTQAFFSAKNQVMRWSNAILPDSREEFNSNQIFYDKYK